MQERTGTKDEVIKGLSTTHRMKLLYFTCLQSAFDENGRYQKDNLFKYFNNWVAYPNGPVEQSVYDHITIQRDKDKNFEDV